jgi:hypothetical protein
LCSPEWIHKNKYPKLVMYICLMDLSRHDTPFDKHVRTHADVNDLLKECRMRGIPRIIDARVQWSSWVDANLTDGGLTTNHGWIISTQGSNFDETCLQLSSVIDVHQSQSEYLHDIKGIQAKRNFLASRLETLLRACGSRVDSHHTLLIADWMTYAGLNGFTRGGMASATDSTIRLLIENLSEHVKQFARTAAREHIKGVTECVMIGNLPRVGTGFGQSTPISTSVPAALAGKKRCHIEEIPADDNNGYNITPITITYNYNL